MGHCINQTPVGHEVAMFVSVCFLSNALLVGLFLHRYRPLIRLSVVDVVVYFCWLLAALPLFLLPGDIASSWYESCLLRLSQGLRPLFHGMVRTTALVSNEQEGDLPNCGSPTYLHMSLGERNRTWSAVYWTTFVFTWFLIPFMQGYVLSGSFTIWRRSMYSIKLNTLLYVIGFVVVLLFALYVRFFTHSAGTWTAVVALLMAITNAIGLLAVVIFLGHGLVNVPVQLWMRGDVHRRLLELEEQAPKLRDQVEEAWEDLASVVQEIDELARSVQSQSVQLVVDERSAGVRELEAHVRKLQDGCSNLDAFRSASISNNPSLTIIDQSVSEGLSFDQSRRVDSLSSIHSRGSLSNGAVAEERSSPTVGLDELERLHGRLKEAKSRKSRIEWQWSRLCKSAWKCEDILIMTSHVQPRDVWIMIGQSSWKFWWAAYIRNGLYKMSSVLCAILSLVLLWSEISLVMVKKKPALGRIIGYFELHSASSLQWLTFVLFTYLVVCTYSALLEMPFLARYFQLVPGQQTDSKSLLFYAMSFTRLTLPLAFNFLLMVEPTLMPAEHKTQFSLVMGLADLVPFLGHHFNMLVPASLAGICMYALIIQLQTHLSYSDQLTPAATADHFGSTSSSNVNMHSRSITLQQGRSLVSQARQIHQQSGMFFERVHSEA